MSGKPTPLSDTALGADSLTQAFQVHSHVRDIIKGTVAWMTDAISSGYYEPASSGKRYYYNFPWRTNNHLLAVDFLHGLLGPALHEQFRRELAGQSVHEHMTITVNPDGLLAILTRRLDHASSDEEILEVSKNAKPLAETATPATPIRLRIKPPAPRRRLLDILPLWNHPNEDVSDVEDPMPERSKKRAREPEPESERSTAPIRAVKRARTGLEPSAIPLFATRAAEYLLKHLNAIYHNATYDEPGNGHTYFTLERNRENITFSWTQRKRSASGPLLPFLVANSRNPAVMHFQSEVLDLWWSISDNVKRSRLVTFFTSFPDVTLVIRSWTPTGQGLQRLVAPIPGGRIGAETHGQWIDSPRPSASNSVVSSSASWSGEDGGESSDDIYDSSDAD